MNRQRYQVVFNRLRGQFMVVAETASRINGTASSSPASSSSPATGDGCQGFLRGLRFSSIAVLIAMSLNTVVHAQILTDRNAPKSQQATVLVTGNGVPVVNIKTPSASGVSVNTFTQFDVNANGAILNNARTAASTQLGGYVQGNPWLSTGPARVIVNQVNSSNPSYLRGYVEVAGSKADVIIANPAGLVCSGCGFINANRSTLTTGSPIINGGNLDAYHVTGGTVTIDGAGMDASGADYTSIITRAVKVNAGIWAKNLAVSTGTNTVNPDNTEITPETSTGDKPQLAIDVAQLGGMYAQHIYLVANEHGVGVRNAGTIGASVGEVVVTADGHLENIGKLAAADALKVNVTGAVNNTGVMGAHNAVTVQAGALQNTGDLNAAQGSVNVATQGSIGNQGRIEAAQSVALNSGALNNTNGLINADRIAVDTHEQAFENSNGTVAAQSGLSINSGALINNAGLIQARGNVDIDTHTQLLTNTNSGTNKGILSNSALTLNTGALNNQSGYLSADQIKVETHQQALNNATGNIVAKSAAGITSGKIDNSNGVISGERVAVDTHEQALNNTNGKLAATTTLNITSGTLDNQRGVISGGDVAIDTQQQVVNNTDGKVLAKSALAITSGTTDNIGGIINGDRVTVDTHQAALNNSSGSITGQSTLAINSGALNNDAGALQARQSLDINTHGQALTNTHAGTDKGIVSEGKLNVASGEVDNRDGYIGAGQAAINTGTNALHNTGGSVVTKSDLTIDSGKLNNNVGVVNGGNVTIDTHGEALQNVAGQLVAKSTLKTSSGELDNSRGLINADQISLDTHQQALTNATGKVIAKSGLDISSGTLDNSNGQIDGGRVGVNTNAQVLNNAAGNLVAQSILTINSGALNNDAGAVQARGNLTIDTHGQALTNTHSGTTKGIVSEGAIAIAAGDIDNREGYVGAASNLALSGKEVQNTGGSISSTNTIIAADKLNNAAGKVQGKASLKVNAQDSIDNTAGLLRADGNVALSANTLINNNTKGKEQGIEGSAVSINADTVSNNNGTMRTDTLLDIATGKALDNTSGLLSSAGNVAIHDTKAVRALAITNDDGTIIAGQQLDIATATADGKGKLLSQKDLSLDVASDLKLTGQVGATNNATIKVGGDLVNTGSVAAGGNLNIAANNIDNQVDGKLLGNNVDITANDTLANRGLIDGTNVAVSANTVNNIGTGRLYGDNLSIVANTVNNGAETIDGKTTAAVIAARNRLDIGANTLNNSEHGLIYSAGDMAIGGQLDKDKHATGRAVAVNNSSATINAEGNLTMAADSINNTNAHLETKDETSAGKRIISYRTNGSTQMINGSDAVIYHKQNGQIVAPENWLSMADVHQFRLLLPSAQYPFERYGPPFDYSRGPQLTGSIGGGMAGVGEAYSMGYQTVDDQSGLVVITQIYHYGPTDKIWSIFGIEAPKQKIPPKPVEPVEFQPCDGGLCQVASYERDHAAWKVAYAQWDVIYQAEFGKYQALNNAIITFNQGLNDRMVAEWTIYDGTEKITKTVVTKSDPGMITSGGNMQLNAGTVNNTASQYIAGGNVAGYAMNGTRINNIGPQGKQTVVTEGSATYTLLRKPSGHGLQRRYLDAQYQSQTIETNFPLDITATGGTVPVRNDAIKTVASTVTGASGQTGSGQQDATRAIADQTGNAQTSPIRTVAAQSGDAAMPTQVRTVNPNLTLPNNALYRIDTTPGNRYLVETDPQFANYKQWLSSDYMLDQIKRSPDVIFKRLGDGYYEQQLIQQQIQQTTGQRYLAGYTSNEAQYMALMNAGVQMAKAFNYEPGIALSDTQMAQLTSDIVWMVKQTVTLADGSTQEVLAPQVYLRTNRVQVTGQGTLIAGNNVAFQTAQDIVNSGTIAARNNVVINARDIDNQSGRIAANNVALTAAQDINNNGGNINGNTSATLRAGRDIKIHSTTVDTANATTTGSNINRTASVTGGDVTIAAARDVTANAATIAATGNTQIAAGRDVNLGTVNQHYREEVNWASDSGGSNMLGILSGPNFVDDANGAHGTKEVGVNRAVVTGSQDVSSQITGKNIAIQAGNDLSTKGTQVIADQALVATAGNNVNISTANSSASARDQHQQSENGILSSTTKQTDDSSSYSHQNGSTFSGDATTIVAGNNASITGSDIVSTKGTQIAAGNDISIKAARDISSEAHYRKETTSGVFSGGGLGVTVGSKMQSTDQTRKAETASASTVGTIEGNVSISAGNAYAQTGSDVLAPQGNIDINAKKVDIQAAMETERTTQDIKFKQQGVTLQITSPVISAIQTVQQMDEAASSTSDSRTRALAQAGKLLAGKNAFDAIQAGQGSVINGKPNQIATVDANGQPGSRDATNADKVGGINIAISLGASSSESHVEQNVTHAKDSTVAAGGNVNISAQGGGAASNLVVQGSDLKAGNNLALKADNEVKLLAAQNTSEQHSNNKNISGSVGVSFGTDGLMFNAGLSGGKGHGDGTEITQVNTHANVGNKLTISSGTDTTLNGAVASGKQVEVNVGTSGQGNLNIASLQDTSNYHSSQQQMGGSISLGAGKMSGSVSASHSKVDATYASVIEQSSINAGDGGFQIKVNGNTDLKGAKITSTDKAIADGKNSLTTQTLTTSDIQNHSSYDAESHSASLSGGYTGSQAALNRPGLGYGSAGDSQSSTTQSGISELAGDKSVRSDKDSSNKLAKEWDGQALQQDVTTQAQVMQTVVPQAAKLIGDVATQQMKEALERGDAEAVEKWKDGGIYRVALHTLLGALSGGAAGATGAAATAVSVPAIADAIKQLGLPDSVASSLIAVAGTAIGAAAGGAQGAAIGFNQTTNNYLKHAEDEKKLREKASCSSSSDPSKCRTEVEKSYNEVGRDRQQRKCTDAQSCRSNRDEITTDLQTTANRQAELDRKLYQGRLTEQEQQEYVSNGQQIQLMQSALQEANRQLRSVIPSSQWTSAERDQTLTDAMIAAGGLATASAAKGVKSPAKENSETGKTNLEVPATKNTEQSSGSAVPSKVADEIAALERIKNKPNGPDLENMVPNSVLNDQAIKDLKKGKIPGTPAGDPWTPREMAASPNPNASAEDFALKALGRSPTLEDYQRGSTMNKGDCPGCWVGRTGDGTWVSFRPAGYSSDGTLPTTANVNLNNPQSLNQLNLNRNGRALEIKLKFPLTGKTGVGK